MQNSAACGNSAAPAYCEVTSSRAWHFCSLDASLHATSCSSTFVRKQSVFASDGMLFLQQFFSPCLESCQGILRSILVSLVVILVSPGCAAYECVTWAILCAGTPMHS